MRRCLKPSTQQLIKIKLPNYSKIVGLHVFIRLQAVTYKLRKKALHKSTYFIVDEKVRTQCDS